MVVLFEYLHRYPVATSLTTKRFSVTSQRVSLLKGRTINFFNNGEGGVGLSIFLVFFDARLFIFTKLKLCRNRSYSVFKVFL